MGELDGAIVALWAVAPVYLAIRRATRRSRQAPRAPRPRALLRAVPALLLLGVAIWLATRRDLVTATVTVLAAVTAVASVMALLAPVRPRLARCLAVLAPCIATLVTLCAGGCHGA